MRRSNQFISQFHLNHHAIIDWNDAERNMEEIAEAIGFLFAIADYVETQGSKIIFHAKQCACQLCWQRACDEFQREESIRRDKANRHLYNHHNRLRGK